MITSIQKASFIKRISAFLLDFICIVILTVGGTWLVSKIAGYDKHVDKVEEFREYYETTYDVKFDLTEEEINELSEEDKARYDEVDKMIQKDEDFIKEYNLVMNITYLMITFGTLIGVMITEFVIPLILKNGQTLGKKVFNLCVIKVNGVKATNLQLFVRALLGKFTVEIMIPVFVFIMLMFGTVGLGGGLLILLLTLLQIILYIVTKNHTVIHDIFSYTVVCDKETQMIFDTENDLLEYKKKNHLEQVNSERS